MSEDKAEPEPLVFTKQPLVKPCCQLCCSIFKNPVITECEHMLCQRRTMKSLQCSMDNARLEVMVNSTAVPSRSRSSPSSAGIASPAVGAGKPTILGVDLERCPFTIKLGSQKDHEGSCDHKPVQCPNNPSRLTFLEMNLEAHLKE
uniref:Uncharacterized protein n=1 Tax=Molossus molossus TaxID=27622 RepID=A0A7J8GQM2_MOLMO|nr:hypothetical protein HJG59_011304 [Molossus molossus]